MAASSSTIDQLIQQKKEKVRQPGSASRLSLFNTNTSSSDIKSDSSFMSKETNLRLFETFPFPRAADAFSIEKPNIIFATRNSPDGVGDMMHLLRFGRDSIKLATENGYGLIGILQIGAGVGEEFDLIFKTIENELKTHSFDKLYVLLNDGRHGYKSRLEQLHLPNVMVKDINTYCQDQDYISDLDKACILVEIITGAFSSIRYTNKRLLHVTIDEYACNSPVYPFQFLHPNMGLSVISGKKDSYGIHLAKFKKYSLQQKAESLLNFKTPGFVSMLLNTPEPTIDAAKDYFSTTLLFPGYLQATGVAHVFIGAHVYKNMRDGRLTKHCDFLLNKACIDEPGIRAILNKTGIFNIHFVSANSLRPVSNADQSSEPGVRIIAFRTEQDDYAELYRLTEGAGTAFSGDNSASDAFSSFSIPFSTYFHCCSSFYDNFFCRLSEFLSLLTREENGEEVIIYSKLVTYFSQLKTTLSNHSFESFQLANRDDGYLDKHIELIKKFGNVLKDPSLQLEWELLRNRLVTDYNYSQNYQFFILKGLLYLASNNYDFNYLFGHLSFIKKCRELGVLTESSMQG